MKIKLLLIALVVVFSSSLVKSQPDTTNQDYQKIQKLLLSKEPIIWLFTGNSITHGVVHTNGSRSYSEHFAELIRFEKKRMRDFVINTGISGAWIPEIINDFNWRVKQFHPKVVSIMIGMNDAAKGEQGRESFKKDLSSFIDSVRSIGAIPIIHTTNPTYPFHKASEARKDLPAYNIIIREIAKEKNLILVDHYKHWQECKKTNEELLTWLNDRSIHPNEFGHREIAKELFKALGLFSKESPTCNLFVP
jgi:acyl-CoA thioesterase I